MKENKFLIGIALCMIATMAWGGMFIVTNEILMFMDPFYMTLLRYVPAGIVFAIILLVIEGKKGFNVKKKDLLKLWGLGTLGFCGFSFLVFTGQSLNEETGGIIASIMMGIQPIIAVFISKIYFKNKINIKTVGYMILALIGVILIVTKGNIVQLFDMANILPVLLIFIGATCWVTYSMGISRFSNYTPIKYTALTNLLGGLSIVIITIFLTIVGILTPPLTSDIVSLFPDFVYLIFIAGAVAVLSWNYGNRILKPINASLFMALVPTTTLIVSVLGFGYQISSIEIIGLSLVIISLVGNNFVLRNKKS